MPRVAIGNHKGGSGKTAATVNLAAALAEAGHKVLVVDLDPQANASRRLGIRPDPDNPTPTIADAVEASAPDVTGSAYHTVIPCGWPAPYADRIDVVPSSFDLENVIEQAARPGAVGRVARALDGIDDEYAITLIDCPPSIGHITQMGLVASHYAVTTVEPEFDSVEGAQRFRDFVRAYAQALGVPELRLIGAIICRVRHQLGAHSYQIEHLPAALGEDLIWSPTVPERAAIKDAADTAAPLASLRSVAAAGLVEVWAELATELAKRVIA